MEETKIILGWIMNTCSLKISFPVDKHKHWISEIEKLLLSTEVHFKHLESLEKGCITQSGQA
jgi:hypothetical protein